MFREDAVDDLRMTESDTDDKGKSLSLFNFAIRLWRAVFDRARV